MMNFILDNLKTFFLGTILFPFLIISIIYIVSFLIIPIIYIVSFLISNNFGINIYLSTDITLLVSFLLILIFIIKKTKGDKNEIN